MYASEVSNSNSLANGGYGSDHRRSCPHDASESHPLSGKLSCTFVLARAEAPLLGWGGVGFVVRLVLTVVPILLALIVAMTRLQGRSLEQWAIVLWRYWHLPKEVIWHATSFEASDIQKGDEV